MLLRLALPLAVLFVFAATCAHASGDCAGGVCSPASGQDDDYFELPLDDDEHQDRAQQACAKTLRVAFDLLKRYKPRPAKDASPQERRRHRFAVAREAVKDDDEYKGVVRGLVECLESRVLGLSPFQAGDALLDLHKPELGMSWLYRVFRAYEAAVKRGDFPADPSIYNGMAHALLRPTVLRLRDATVIFEKALNAQLRTDEQDEWKTWKQRKQIDDFMYNRVRRSGARKTLAELRDLYARVADYRSALQANRVLLLTGNKSERESLLREGFTFAASAGRLKESIMYKVKYAQTSFRNSAKDGSTGGTYKQMMARYNPLGLFHVASALTDDVWSLTRSFLAAPPQPVFKEPLFPERAEQDAQEPGLRAFREVAEACGYAGEVPSSAETVSRGTVVDVLIACMHKQKVISSVLKKKDVDIHKPNKFGWSPVHYFAWLGDAQSVLALIDRGAHVDARTHTGITPLQIAAMHGHTEVIKEVANWTEATYPGLDIMEWSDDDARNPVDLACALRWPAKSVLPLLGKDLGCPRDEAAEEEFRMLAHASNQDKVSGDEAQGGGGWKRFPALGSEPSGLGSVPDDMDRLVEVRDGLNLTADELIKLYLSIEKPVLIRRAVDAGEGVWKTLHELFSRGNLRKSRKMRSLPVTRIASPYAKAFGDNRTAGAAETTLGEYLDYMRGEALTQETPDCVYESVFSPSSGKDNGHPFSKALQVPDHLTLWKSKIELRDSFKVYIGPARSGTAMHYEIGTYDVCLFGRKHVFLLPPKHAWYSRLHGYTWYKTEYPALVENGPIAPLELIQEAGDVLLLPAFWGHAAVNLEETVGVSVRFRHGLTATM